MKILFKQLTDKKPKIFQICYDFIQFTNKNISIHLIKFIFYFFDCYDFIYSV